MQRLPFPHGIPQMEAIRFTLSNNVLPMGQLSTAGLGVGQAGASMSGAKPVGQPQLTSLGMPGGVMPHRFTSGMKPTNVNLATQGQILYQLYPNVRLKPLPFYEVIAEIQRPTLLLPRVKTYFKFNFTPKQAQDIAMARRDLPNGKKEFRVQVQARFCYIEQGEQSDKLPPGLVATVNGIHVQLPEILPHRHNEEAKRANLPIDITEQCKMSASGTNHVEISWASEQGKSYCVNVKLVKKLTPETLLNKLTQFGNRNANYTRALIRDKLKHDGDREIATTSLRVSLIDPLMKTRMTNPCRTESCTHLQCFDAKTFLMMNDKKARWKCPVCDKPTRYVDLYIDKLFTEILQECTDAEEIEFCKDGTWTIVVKEEEHTNKDRQYSPFTSSGRGTPASDIPKDEEMIDLISDDEDSPPPTVDKSLPPSNKSQLDQPKDLTIQSSQTSGNSQSTPSFVGSQLPLGLATSHLGVPNLAASPAASLSVPRPTLSTLDANVSKPGSSVATGPAIGLSIQNPALNELAGMINEWGSSMSRLNDAMVKNLNARSDLTKSLESWTSTLSKRNESTDLQQLVNSESKATNESSRPPSSLSSRPSSKQSQDYNSDSEGRYTTGEDIIRSSTSSGRSSQQRRITSSTDSSSADSDTMLNKKKSRIKKTKSQPRVLDDTSSNSSNSHTENKIPTDRKHSTDSESSADVTNRVKKRKPTRIESDESPQKVKQKSLSKDSSLSNDPSLGKNSHVRKDSLISRDSRLTKDSFESLRSKNKDSDSDSDIYIPINKRNRTNVIEESDDSRDSDRPLSEVLKKDKVKSAEEKVDFNKFSSQNKESNIKVFPDYVLVGRMKYIGKLQPVVKIADLAKCHCKNCSKYKDTLKHITKYVHPESSIKSICAKIIPEVLETTEDNLSSTEKEHQTEAVNDVSETVEYGTDTSEDSLLLDFSEYSSSSSSGSDWEIDWGKKKGKRGKMMKKDGRKKRKKIVKGVTKFREAREKWLKKKAKTLKD